MREASFPQALPAADQAPRSGKCTVVPELFESGDRRLDLLEIGIVFGLAGEAEGSSFDQSSQLSSTIPGAPPGFERLGQDLVGTGELARLPQCRTQLWKESQAPIVALGPEGDRPREQVDGGRHVSPRERAPPGRSKEFGGSRRLDAVPLRDGAELAAVPDSLLEVVAEEFIVFP